MNLFCQFFLMESGWEWWGILDYSYEYPPPVWYYWHELLCGAGLALWGYL